MNPLDDAQSVTGERRQSVRQSIQSKIKVTIEAFETEARAENISHTDVLFFTEQGIPVTVEVEEDGVVKRTQGQLVRLQRLRGGSSGWAVEFDR